MLLASLPRSFARRFFPICAVLLATTVALFAQSPSAFDGFDPNIDGNVYAVATQPDGKILIAGQFSNFRPNGTTIVIGRNNIARLNPDGTLDPAFDPNANGPIRALVLQPDGRILIGGDFTTLQPAGSGAATGRSRVARLNADGSVDAGFNPNVGGFTLPQVFALALQADGAVVVGGSFSTVQPTGAATATTRNNIARFTSAGALDASYNPNPNGMVFALALHLEGKIVVGGGFTSFQENTKPDATTRGRIARLNRDGTLDSEFNPNANSGVTSLAIQRDGKVVLGGYFTTLQPVGNDSPTARNHVGRLNPDGTLDSEFFPNAGGSVMSLGVEPDGGLLIGGTFTSVWGRGSTTLTRGYLARFAPDGEVDPAFNPGLNAEVDAFAIQADGKIVVGGHFTRAQPPGALTSISRNRIVRLNSNGTVDANFEIDGGGRPLVSAVQADGKIVVGGSFTNVAGVTHDYLARLNADGTVDASYAPDLNGRVFAMAVQPDGKIVIGGAFTTIGGEPRSHLARLNPSGTIDSEFNPNVDGQVATVVLQSDGKILIGGSFFTIQPLGVTTPIARNNVARLTAAGQVDTPFDPSANSTVTSIAVQSDGKIILGGSFTSLTPNAVFTTTTTGGVTTTTSNGVAVTRNYVARVNADGTLDTAYDPNFNSQINALVLQSDGKLVAGGTFAALLQPGATVPTTRSHVARINADGTIDTTFDPNANGTVIALALQSDQKILIGGTFTTVQPNGAADWTQRKYVARLNTDGTADPGFNLDLNELTGNRVDSIRVGPDGRILLGGNFTSLQPIGASSRVLRKNFARINTNGTLDTTFDIGPSGPAGALVNALAIQADGKIVAAGSFSDLGAAKTSNIARFNPEGTVDSTFGTTLTVDGPVNALVVRPNGSPIPTQLSGFAWLNRDGSLRTSFAPSADAKLSGQINAVAVQPDGSVLVGGSFVNLTNATNGSLVRFKANGTLDTSFSPSIAGDVSGIVLQSDGRIIIVGGFLSVNGTTRNRLARLESDGSLDNGYDPNASARVDAIVLQSDGTVVIGGSFTTLTPNGATTAITRNYLAKLNTDGTVDDKYNPSPNGPVNSLTIQGDGKVIAGGAFTTVQPDNAAAATNRNFVLRLNTDGTLDTNFNPNANATVYSVVAQPNGFILIGGSFTALQPNGASDPIARTNLARVGSDGALDLGFIPNPNNAVTSIALQADGSIIVGGIFTTLQPKGSSVSITRNHLARLNSDGSLDTSFNPDVTGVVGTVATRPDGSILVTGNFTGLQANGLLLAGGSFATIGGIPSRNLALINDDGSINSSFQAMPNGAVNALLALPDGRAVVGGAFTAVGNTTRNRIARLNSDGTIDTVFNPNAGGTVSALALQADGKTLVGGAFSTVGGQSRFNLARLNTDGSVDGAFSPAATVTGAVTGIAVQGDGRIVILITGTAPRNAILRLNADGSNDATFTSVNGGADVISAIALQVDGRVVIGGAFSTIGGSAIPRLARLNANGTVDTSFNAALNGAVTALAMQSDGRLMLGGTFSTIGGLTRVGVARLTSPIVSAQTLGVTADRTSVVLARSGWAGELAGVTFERSNDGLAWGAPVAGTRIANTSNWQLTGQSLPASGLFYIRARGIAPSSAGTSSSLYEIVREFNYTNPVPAPASLTGNPSSQGVSIDEFTGIAVLSGVAAPSGTAGSGDVPATGSSIGSTSPVTSGGTDSVRLADISSRAVVSAANPLIAGFALTGNSPHAVLVRAVGPGLAVFGVQGALSAPKLRLFNSAGQLVASNDGWAGAASLSAAFVRTGAFPLPANSADAAALVTLPPGSYSMQVVDGSGAGGVALAEVYDADAGSQAGGSRLSNLSSRGTAGAGNGAFVGGFVLSGNFSKRILVRGIGPALAKFGVNGVLTDPSVSIYDSANRLIASNDNWNSAQGSAGGDAATIANDTLQAGAFALDAGSKDAALSITLAPGAYTVQVTDPSGAGGAALIEVYELP